MTITRSIPIVDLSPFFKGGDEGGKKAAIDLISEACSEYGFFQIVNHGVPLELMSSVLQLFKAFFEGPTEEKLKYSSPPGASRPTGYMRFSDNMGEVKQMLMIYPPESNFNVFPSHPPEFRDVLEEVFSHFAKAGRVVEKIIGEGLGLPSNFMSDFNDDRNCDILTSQYYSAATADGQIGTHEHKDSNFITFVLQDDVGGLEAWKDGEWIQVNPIKGALVVNLGDDIKVMTNDKYESSMHRVMRTKGKARTSLVFFYSLAGDKWVEPLPQFTTEIGQQPKYKRYLEGEYTKLRLNDMSTRMKNGTSISREEIKIDHYAIRTT